MIRVWAGFDIEPNCIRTREGREALRQGLLGPQSLARMV